jgi:TIR domain/Tetratricopeptide repeat
LVVSMQRSPSERYDFFLSRRGSVAHVAQEVANVLTDKGYKVLIQDYDIPFSESFVEAMHEGIKNSRDLIILYTEDYERSPYTRKEFTSFEAERLKTAEERHIIVLRCEDVSLRGLLADNVYQTLVGIEDPEERKRRIIAAAEGQSQAAPPPPKPFIGVPLRIATFTGRADELDRLDAILMKDNPAAATQASVGRAAVHGMGGVGKTSLAIEYAHRYRNLYAGVCWCPAETRVLLVSRLAELGSTLGVVRSDEPDVEKAAKAGRRRLNEQRATWLLVYDNVAAPDQTMTDLLPSGGARVLITSRFSDWSELAGEVALDVLLREEAVALLESRTGRSDAAGANTLAEALGCLPLALDHAAAYCKRTQMHFGEYAQKASRLIDAAPHGAIYRRSVTATFDLAITNAVAQCRAAESLMGYLAQCAPERIPMILIDGAIEDEAERQQALAALAEVSLLKHDPFEDGTPAVSVHRLVQVAERARAEAFGLARDTIGRLIRQLVEVYPPKCNDTQPWTLCTQLTPHVLACRDASPYGASQVASRPDLLDRAGMYFSISGAFDQAEQLFRDSLAIREKANSEHPDTATSLCNIGLLLRRKRACGYGNLARRAPQFFEDTVLIGKKEAGGADFFLYRETGASLSEHSHMSDDVGIALLFERALEIRQKAIGAQHADTMKVRRDLAYERWELGDTETARRLLERSLEVSETAFGSEDLITGECLEDLGLLRWRQGEAKGAMLLYERALAILESTLGPKDQRTLDMRERFAMRLFEQRLRDATRDARGGSTNGALSFILWWAALTAASLIIFAASRGTRFQQFGAGLLSASLSLLIATWLIEIIWRLLMRWIGGKTKDG